MALLSPTAIALFLLLGAAAGLMAGLFGIGGGIVLIPLFLWIFPLAGFPPEITVHCAFGTSLAVIVPTAVSSVLAHRRWGNVEWRQVAGLSGGGVFGAVAGAACAALLTGVWLRGLFGLMQVGVGLKLLLRPRHLPPEREDRPPLWQLFGVGAATGAFSAFFGVGGGVIAVPLMVIFLELPLSLAVGNSSALIAVSSVFGALSYAHHGWGTPGLPPLSLGYVNLLVFLLVSPSAILAARFGVRIAARLQDDTLMRLFSILLIAVGIRILVSTFGR